MSGYQATGRVLIERLSQAAEAKSIYPVALGCTVSAGLTALYLIWQSAFGHLRFVTEHPFTDPEMIGPRIALTVILLTGFIVGGAAYGRRENIRDAEPLGTLLRGSPLIEALGIATVPGASSFSPTSPVVGVRWESASRARRSAGTSPGKSAVGSR